MQVREFIATARRRLGDPVKAVTSDQMWSDSELIEYLTESCYEFARRTEYFKSVSDPMCIINVTANDPWVSINDRIIKIHRAKLDLATNSLRVLDMREEDFIGGKWEDDTGEPRAILLGIETGRGRFDRIPIVADTLRLQVTYLPAALTAPGDLIPVPDRWALKLLPGVRAQAYSKQDADAYDANKSLDLKGEFEMELTKIKRELMKQRRRRGTASRYGGP